MLQNEIKSGFIELGKFLSQFSLDNSTKNDKVLNNNLFFNDFLDLIKLSQSHNGWYTPENIFYAINSWANALTNENLDLWLSKYSLDCAQEDKKSVGIILAGNIPLVGFHDFLSVLISDIKF